MSLSIEERMARLEEAQHLTTSHFDTASLAIMQLWGELKKFRDELRKGLLEMREGLLATNRRIDESHATLSREIDAKVKNVQFTLDGLVKNLPGIITEAIRAAR